MHIADDVIVRAERLDDWFGIDHVLTSAFPSDDAADKWRAVRETTGFIPEMSLVADVCDDVVGYVALTRLTIGGQQSNVLGLGPVAVVRKSQDKGVGGVLIKYALKFAEMRGISGVVVAGLPSYFKRFGFQPAEDFGLIAPAGVDKAGLLVVPLGPSIRALSGIVGYDANGMALNSWSALAPSMARR